MQNMTLTSHHSNFLAFLGKCVGLAVLADAAYTLQDKAGTPSVLLDPVAFNAILTSGFQIISAQPAAAPVAVTE